MGASAGRKGPTSWAHMTREMAGTGTLLLDGQGAAGQSRVDPDHLRGGEHGPVEELIPDGQGESEIDVPGPVEPMVDPVIVGARPRTRPRAPNPRLILEWARVTTPP